MSTKARGIHGHPSRKLGRRRDDYSKPKLDLTRLATTAADFSKVPATQENLTAPIKSALRVLGNDVAGVCNPVRWANNRLMMTGVYPSAEGKSTQRLVWDLYATQNPDFVPGNGPNGNGSDADAGMATDELLDYLHKVGGPDGTKLVAYGTIDPNNVTAVERALAIFKCVWVDLLVLSDNQDEFDAHQAWTPNGSLDGAHAVLGSGYVPERRVITWADEVTLSEAYWSGVYGAGKEPIVERVYLPIWPEHASAEFADSPYGQALAEDYRALTNKTIVWPQPAPTPQPPPAYTLSITDPEVMQHLSRTIGGHDASEWANHHFRSYFKIK